MKKLFALCGTCALLSVAVAFAPKPTMVYAEGDSSEPEITEVVEPTEEVEEDAWSQFVEEYLNADKVAMYMSWVAYIGTIIGLAVNIKKLKKTNNLTLENVRGDVLKELKHVVTEAVTEEVQKFLPALTDAQNKTNDVLKIFSKILALSQENSPESRLAILNLIEELGNIGKEVTDAAKQFIEEEVKAIEEHKEEVEEKLNEIIDSMDSYDGTSI